MLPQVDGYSGPLLGRLEQTVSAYSSNVLSLKADRIPGAELAASRDRVAGAR